VSGYFDTLPFPNWDEKFLGLCEYIAKWSKDPSTKVGAVIVRPDRTIVSTGYNGFPRGIADKPELLASREEKYKRVIHAEVNAILTAREPLTGCTLYCSLMTCERCAVIVIQAGIKRVVAQKMSIEQEERWGEALKLAHQLYAEAGVQVTQL
jgi:dCMP deaminase